jgi:large subunit ribosomal protein L21
MFAVIKTGGKQYKVAQDDVIVVEKLNAEAGDAVAFDAVLMIGGDTVTIGAPMIEGAQVRGEIVTQQKGEKALVFKKKKRSTYRRKRGHRQHETIVKITEIVASGATAGVAPKKAAAPKAAPKAAAKAEAAPEAATAQTGAVDDLSLISGVGKVLVGKLNGLGITSLKQIATLTPEQIAEIDEKLSFKGRIEREEWVAQANELLAGQAPRAKTDQKAAKAADKKD